MSNISEHDSKEERVSYDVEGSWVHLLVSWFSVCFHNFMEGPDKVVDFEVSGRLELVISYLGDLSHSGSRPISD